MPTRIVALAVLAGCGWCTPAAAQQADVNREWKSSLLFHNRTDLWGLVSWGQLGSAGTAVVWQTSAWDPWEPEPLRAAVRARGGGLGPVQVLETGSVADRQLASSAAGGALVIWYQVGAPVRFAELPPGGHAFSPPETLAEKASGGVAVAMNERGDAALAYRTEDGLWLRRRPAGGELAAPELVADADAELYPELAVAPAGDVLVSSVRGKGFVRIGHPGEPLSPPYPLASSTPPAVGSDAHGNAVAAWIDYGTTGQGGHLMLAFKPRAAAGFGPPRDTGVYSTAFTQRDLHVTASGELIVAVTTWKPLNGGLDPTGSVAFFGDVRRQLLGPVTPLATAGYARTRAGANERGDAVVVYAPSSPPGGEWWDWNHLRIRRRPPHGSFGPAHEYWQPSPQEASNARMEEHPQLDSYGNAQMLWWADLDATGGGAPQDVNLAEDGPLLTQPPPPVEPSDGPLPPVLEPDPSAPAPPPVASADTTAPRVRVRIERRVRGRSAFARVRCSEWCAIRVRHGIASVAKRATGAKLSAGRERRLRLRLTKKTVRSLRHSRHGRKLHVELKARDAAGNSRRVRRTARVRIASRSRPASRDPR